LSRGAAINGACRLCAQDFAPRAASPKMFRHSRRNPLCSSPCRHPRHRPLPGSSCSISSAALAFGVPVASHTRLSTINRLRFSTSRFPAVAQLASLARTFARICASGSLFDSCFSFEPLLAAIIYRGIPGITGANPFCSWLKTLRAGPSFQQTSVHREVFVRPIPARGCSTTSARNSLATSASSKRSGSW